jgi:hypothetical protein
MADENSVTARARALIENLDIRGEWSHCRYLSTHSVIEGSNSTYRNIADTGEESIARFIAAAPALMLKMIDMIENRPKAADVLFPCDCIYMNDGVPSITCAKCEGIGAVLEKIQINN